LPAAMPAGLSSMTRMLNRSSTSPSLSRPVHKQQDLACLSPQTLP
jgi:hypothetical protein